MSMAEGVFTLAEIDAQIANIKQQLLAENAGYSVSPSGGGTSRSVNRNDRGRLNAELTLWMKRRAALAGARRGGIRVKRAILPRRCC